MSTDLLLPSNLTVINATPFTWHKILNDSSQVVQWDSIFPDQIESGDIFSIPLEFTGANASSEPDSVVIYTYNDPATNSSLDLSLTATSAASDTPISLSISPETESHDVANVLSASPKTLVNFPLTPNTTAGTPIILSTSNVKNAAPAIPLTDLPTDYLQASLPLLGCHPLRHICLSGSHDSGMSTLTHSTFLSIPENTLTQWTDMLGQLNQGARYFDLRPVISAGQFVSGHYSKIGDNWVGGNGQSIADIITQVNQFLSTNNELVILDLSHIYNTDDDWRGLTTEEFSRLLTQLNSLEHRYSGPTGPNGDLSVLPLNSFIGKQNPCVLIIISDNIPLPADKPAGVFPLSGLGIYNQYANTPFAPVMKSDQLKKMAAQRKTRDDAMFLLSWTLTTPLDIRALATQAHDMLFDTGSSGLWSTIFKNKQSYPNIIMVDALGKDAGSLAGGKNLAALTMAVNNVVLEGVACPA